MKLYMKQKVFSWTDKFTVKDEMEQDRYFVEGEFLSLTKKLHIRNTSNEELAFIWQKFWSIMPRFCVEIDSREVCWIAKRFTLLRPKYVLEGLNWHVEGDFWSHEYSVYDGDREIMSLSKHWISWGDSYELDIVNPEDELLCLCIVLAIDAATASSRSTTSSSSSS